MRKYLLSIVRKFSLVVCTLLLVFLFVKLLSNYSERFEETKKRYGKNDKGVCSAINLTKDVSSEDLSNVLKVNNYISDKDTDFVAKFISEKLKNGKTLSTLYDLNKHVWQIPVSLIDSTGSVNYVEKAKKSKKDIGQDDEYYAKKNSSLQDSVKVVESNTGMIRIKITEKIDNVGFVNKLLKNNQRPCEGVLVRLSEQKIDSLNKSERITKAWGKTNKEGYCTFYGLDPNLSYSVLPIKEGYEYGTAKGTIGGNLSFAIDDQKSLKDKVVDWCMGESENALECSFVQQEHKIRIFDAFTLKHIKEDGTLTIRSPEDFESTLVNYVALFFAFWWGLFAFVRIKKKTIDTTVMSILMMLSGLCLLTMFSLNDPLTDKLLGVEMAQGIIAGVVIIILLQRFNFVELYQNKTTIDVGRWCIIGSFLWIIGLLVLFVKIEIVKYISVLLFVVFGIAWIQNRRYKKSKECNLIIDFDITIDFVRWLFLPFKQKVSALTSILESKNVGSVLKCVVICAIIPIIILHLLMLFVKWLFLPFWQKNAWFISGASSTKTSKKISSVIVFVVIALLHLLMLIPMAIVNVFKDVKGCGYLLLALLLTLLLFTPLGEAVGGMKVNLNLGVIKFQPSEISKYLIILFIAGFFSVNANKIVQFSERGNTNLFASKLKMMISIFVGLGILMGLYLVLGDMGPALVLAFTFIILYSVIKSKIDLENLNTEDSLKKIFTCDFAMLIYGVLSFTVFLCVGNMLGKGNMGVFCLLWFGVWILMGIAKKQIFETPIFFNFIVAAFIFGGSILGNIGFDSVADRLDGRNEMCVNTWGTLPIDGNTADAGENTQVAEGLWGLASGGLWGQGLGNGSPHFIPAFHTDMILESVGEQLGFVGIFVIILLLAILLRKTIVLGYRTSHPFAFYLCTGIAIVTAIQFIIISLGSTGIIPLTGVTVPFFSYGKVSMILNLAAYGVVLSIASHTKQEETQENKEVAKLTRQNIGKYNYSVSLLSWAYCILALMICGVFFYYQFLNRNNILIKPVYVNNSSGIPIVEYNPRIEQLTRKMHSGDIYDRNGVLLATSDKTKLREFKNIYSDLALECDTLKMQQRYYPFGKHLAFMLGDRNSDLFIFNGSEDNGYLAETRHFSELRGFNNRLDQNGKKCPTVELSTKSMQIDKWHSSDNEYKGTVNLFNYSALIPYLKDGVNDDRIRDFNNRDESWWNIGKIKPKDIHLTIDAKLQTKLQKDITEFIKDVCADKIKVGKEHEKFKRYRNLIRASIVVLDAENGDLLASANYPLPSYERLKDEIVEIHGVRMLPTYSDKGKLTNWTAYTDIDLGLIYPTAPGSTAKVMSALAALKKCGVVAADSNNRDYSYVVFDSQKVGDEPAGEINMKKAIVKSSNCYFINLVNDYDLYKELSYIYRTVGTEVNKKKSYGLFYSDSTKVEEFYDVFNDHNIENAISKYNRYIESGDKSPMKDAIWQWTWGQGDLAATPLSMARVASIVANDGKMVASKYIIEDEVDKIFVVKPKEAKLLGFMMEEEAETHVSSALIKSKNNFIGGKTGTANRHLFDKDGVLKDRSNDAWYICYVKDKTNTSKNTIAIAVRIERGQSSTAAKLLVKNRVLNSLADCGYINKD